MSFSLTLTSASGHSWPVEVYEALVAELRRIDPSLGPPIHADHASVSLVPTKGIGLDWLIDADRIVVAAQVTGVKPERAEQVFAVLLLSIRTLSQRSAIRIFADPLGREVDLEADHESLARAWLDHCKAAAQEHLAATRASGQINLVGSALLLALLLAAAQLPLASQPWIAPAIVIGLGVALIGWLRARARRR